VNRLRRRWGSLLASVTLAAALTVAPAPSSAICDRPPEDALVNPTAAGQVVFVGTAEEVGMNPQNALFQVDEVWHGSPVPVWQAVFSQADGRAIMSTSPSFEQGTTYLVVAKRHDRVLVSVSCGATQAYTEQVRAFRPLEPSAPTAAERPRNWEPNLVTGPPLPLFMGGVALMAGVFLVSRSLFRRRPEESSS